MKVWVLVLTCLGLMATTSLPSAQSFMGFELLDLDGAQVKWGGSGINLPALVKYAVVLQEHNSPGARNCPGMQPIDALLEKSRIQHTEFVGELNAAFDLWEKAANIEFRWVVDPQEADILIGAQSRPMGRAFTNIDYQPGPGPIRFIKRSLICLNPEQPWKIGFDGNLDAYDLRYTLAHEIGHAIGLDHPSMTGELMSFQYDENFRRLQAGDLSGAAQIYGPRASN